MAYMIELPTFEDERGKLTVIENTLPFEIRRVYYIYDAHGKRGGHRHKKNVQALVALGGSCEIYVNDGISKKKFLLDNPKKCLILEPKDWHTMERFSKGSTLMVFASQYYDIDDYIDEPYDEDDRV